jgi:hypothetical protein
VRQRLLRDAQRRRQLHLGQAAFLTRLRQTRTQFLEERLVLGVHGGEQ